MIEIAASRYPLHCGLCGLGPSFTAIAGAYLVVSTKRKRRRPRIRMAVCRWCAEELALVARKAAKRETR